MTDVDLNPSEEAHVQQAADEAFRVLAGDDDPPSVRRLRFSQALREATLVAPLHALAVAFLLGVLVARRR
jgi:hypothetical protein